jgi:protoporphyrinogen oxidase
VVAALRPAASAEALRAAQRLRYRDFIVVALIVRDAARFHDNWIYIHDPDVLVGRVQNFKAWSPEMVPDPAWTCYGLEYFCFAGDGLWCSADEELIDRAGRELAQLGLVDRAQIVKGHVVRQPRAYPVYDRDYAAHVATVRAELSRRYPGLHPVGRNGMHKYNNQDHAMMTALLTARNILEGAPVWDVWKVNQDAEYHESGEAGDPGGRAVPAPRGGAARSAG